MNFATTQEVYGTPSPMPEEYKAVHMQENNKTADIRDAFNRLWYKVIMTGTELSTSPSGLKYVIQVVNYTIEDPSTGEITPLVILTIPSASSVELLTDYAAATKIYSECVEKYTSLVRASTRDLQDIDVFKDKIGYKDAPNLSCCATCQYLHKHRKITSYAQLSGSVDEILNLSFECWNPKNTVEYSFNVNADMSKYPFESLNGELDADEASHKVILKPCVKMLSICDNFEKRS